VIGRLHELAALVADEWPTLGHALAGLRTIDEWGRRHHDARGCFAAAYRIVTVAVAVALDRDEFVDPAWVTRVVLDFAERYRLAVSAAAHGLPGPRCWAAALRHPPDGSLLAIVALLHAMIAHIHHDLAHTLGACAPIHPHRAADYERLGVVICSATPAIQRELVAVYVPDSTRPPHRPARRRHLAHRDPGPRLAGPRPHRRRAHGRLARRGRRLEPPPRAREHRAGRGARPPHRPSPAAPAGHGASSNHVAERGQVVVNCTRHAAWRRAASPWISSQPIDASVIVTLPSPDERGLGEGLCSHRPRLDAMHARTSFMIQTPRANGTPDLRGARPARLR
jgi:hypothetical protein